jgi:hypothetical protein
VSYPGFKKSAEFSEICQNSADLVVANFSKIGIVHAKIGTVHLKFSEKFGIGQVQFFSTH